MKKSAKYWVENLELEPHPEGGFYKETYRSNLMGKEIINFDGDRNFATAIYFLIENGNFSAFHRIKSDEVWHFYYGAALTVHMINLDGNYSFQKIGNDLENKELPQFVVPAGYWFASEIDSEEDFSLVGCTVSPGFDFKDFELADRKTLIDQFPENQLIIEKLTRV